VVAVVQDLEEAPASEVEEEWVAAVVSVGEVARDAGSVPERAQASVVAPVLVAGWSVVAPVLVAGWEAVPVEALEVAAASEAGQVEASVSVVGRAEALVVELAVILVVDLEAARVPAVGLALELELDRARVWAAALDTVVAPAEKLVPVAEVVSAEEPVQAGELVLVVLAALAEELVQVVDSTVAVLGLEEEEDWAEAVGSVVEEARKVGLVVA
jgi:hypothetical protein